MNKKFIVPVDGFIFYEFNIGTQKWRLAGFYANSNFVYRGDDVKDAIKNIMGFTQISSKEARVFEVTAGQEWDMESKYL